jgi:hypothetical protein
VLLHVKEVDQERHHDEPAAEPDEPTEPAAGCADDHRE